MRIGEERRRSAPSGPQQPKAIAKVAPRPGPVPWVDAPEHGLESGRGRPGSRLAAHRAVRRSRQAGGRWVAPGVDADPVSLASATGMTSWTVRLSRLAGSQPTGGGLTAMTTSSTRPAVATPAVGCRASTHVTAPFSTISLETLALSARSGAGASPGAGEVAPSSLRARALRCYPGLHRDRRWRDARARGRCAGSDCAQGANPNRDSIGGWTPHRSP